VRPLKGRQKLSPLFVIIYGQTTGLIPLPSFSLASRCHPVTFVWSNSSCKGASVAYRLKHSS
jgi:hypothetical protein